MTNRPVTKDDQGVPAPGFANPVSDAQLVFRAVLTALSQPGQTVALSTHADVPAGVSREGAMILLALTDAETTLWLAPSLRQSGVGAWLRFHTGVVLVDEPGAAQFVWLGSTDPVPHLESLCQGSDAHPETASTLLVEVAGWLEGSDGWLFSGPGLKVPRHLVIGAAGESRMRELLGLHQNAAASFPKGLDLLLLAPGRLLGIPRTTRLVAPHQASALVALED
jgi:alpha-D-ribose 1-methylphosphonate 5-triphosphate synthase subunit PhnH